MYNEIGLIKCIKAPFMHKKHAKEATLNGYRNVYIMYSSQDL